MGEYWDDKTDTDCYARAVKEAREQMVKVKAARQHVEVCRMARAIFGADLDMCSLSLGVGGFSVRGANIHVNVQNFAQLTPLRRWLREQGYKPTGQPEDYVEIGRRRFPYGHINILAFVKTADEAGEPSSGPTCRVVKVGEKVEPILKIVCDTDAAPEEDFVPPAPAVVAEPAPALNGSSCDDLPF